MQYCIFELDRSEDTSAKQGKDRQTTPSASLVVGPLVASSPNVFSLKGGMSRWRKCLPIPRALQIVIFEGDSQGQFAMYQRDIQTKRIIRLNLVPPFFQSLES